MATRSRVSWNLFSFIFIEQFSTDIKSSHLWTGMHWFDQCLADLFLLMLTLPCLDKLSLRHSPHPTDSPTAQAPFRTPVVTKSAILEPVHHFTLNRFTNAQIALPAVAPWQFRGQDVRNEFKTTQYCNYRLLTRITGCRPNRKEMKIQSLGPWNIETAASISNKANKSVAGER